jgi:hypothetical protein
MPIFTASGTTVGIGPEVDRNTDSVPKFLALQYTPVGLVENLGEFGDEAAEVMFSPLEIDRILRAKGARDAGILTMTAGHDPADVGQTKLSQAELTRFRYAFRIDLTDYPDGGGPSHTIMFFRGLLLSKRSTNLNVDTVLRRSFAIAIDSPVLEFYGTAVPGVPQSFGNIIGSCTVVGVGYGRITIAASGNAPGGCTVVGDGFGSVSVNSGSGTAAGTSTATANAVAFVSGFGTADGTSTATGTGSLGGVASGSASGVGTATGAGTAVVDGIGLADGLSTAVGIVPATNPGGEAVGLLLSLTKPSPGVNASSGTAAGTSTVVGGVSGAAGQATGMLLTLTKAS